MKYEETFIEALSQKIHDSQAALFGKTLFLNNIPAEVTLGAGLFNRLAGDEIDYELPNLFHTSFQLIVRSKNIADGQQLITKITKSITILKETNYRGFKINYVRPRHLPVNYAASDGNLTEFSVNFDACYVMV